METSTGNKQITGMFDYTGVENAYQHLIELGYTSDDINLLMSEETHERHFVKNIVNTEIPDKSLNNAEVGAAIGGTGGAIAGTALALAISSASGRISAQGWRFSQDLSNDAPSKNSCTRKSWLSTSPQSRINTTLG